MMDQSETLLSILDGDLHPAELSFNHEGRLVTAEGHLDWYGLGGARPGMHADEIDFLAAMLPPPEPLYLPMVHTSAGVPRKVLLEPLGGGTRVILLDASRDFALKRCMQQAENMIRLERERSVPPAIFAHSGVAVLERIGNNFRILTGLPDGLAHLLPAQRLITRAFLESSLSFTTYFLPQAEAVWRSGTGPEIRMKWVENDSEGVEYEIEAAALLVDGRQFLTLTSHPEEYAERRQILQKARLLRLSAERQSREIEKKDVLLHAVVHDLIGPLGVITGTLSALGEDLTDVNKRHMCQIALMQCRRQENMIRDMLDIYAADVTRLDAFSTNPSSAPGIAAALRDVVDSLEAVFKAKGVAIAYDSGDVPADTLVSGETSRLERVFANLVENALRYSPRGGEVRVRLQNLPKQVRAEISDQGPGIAADLFPKLFEKFSQGRDKGGKIGLGLFFCRITVERWGGSIGAFNRPEGGAVFWFQLPKVAAMESDGQDTAH